MSIYKGLQRALLFTLESVTDIGTGVFDVIEALWRHDCVSPGNSWEHVIASCCAAIYVYCVVYCVGHSRVRYPTHESVIEPAQCDTAVISS